MGKRGHRKGGFPVKPTGDNKDKNNPYFTVGLYPYNLIYEKFGVSIDEARELDTLTYNLLLRDAVCLKYQETPAGQDYLRECWRLQQTEPDMEELIKYRDRRLN